jgi:hypothetical protein
MALHEGKFFGKVRKDSFRKKFIDRRISTRQASRNFLEALSFKNHLDSDPQSAKSLHKDSEIRAIARRLFRDEEMCGNTSHLLMICQRIVKICIEQIPARRHPSVYTGHEFAPDKWACTRCGISLRELHASVKSIPCIETVHVPEWRGDVRITGLSPDFAITDETYITEDDAHSYMHGKSTFLKDVMADLAEEVREDMSAHMRQLLDEMMLSGAENSTLEDMMAEEKKKTHPRNRRKPKT